MSVKELSKKLVDLKLQYCGKDGVYVASCKLRDRYVEYKSNSLIGCMEGLLKEAN